MGAMTEIEIDHAIKCADCGVDAGLRKCKVHENKGFIRHLDICNSCIEKRQEEIEELAERQELEANVTEILSSYISEPPEQLVKRLISFFEPEHTEGVELDFYNSDTMEGQWEYILEKLKLPSNTEHFTAEIGKISNLRKE